MYDSHINIPYNHVVVGTCSLCGGPVCVPTIWMSVVPPTPTCANCGAMEDRRPNYGPVIPMVPTNNTRWTPDHDNKGWAVNRE